MKNSLRLFLMAGALAPIASAYAQTLTQANSIPAIGTVEHRTYYSDLSAAGLATTGTGNTWNAMGVTAFGVTSITIYRVPGDSPFATTYPATTLCAEVQDGSPLGEWRHFNVTSSIAELLGTGTDAFIGGRTYCEFPFDLGSSFTDSYTVGGNTNNDVVEYVASGEIESPWGTIPNVVMFQINGGPYTFYQANDLLDAIGSYLPGFGLDLWKVDITTGIEVPQDVNLGVWPVPTDDLVHFTLPGKGAHQVIVCDVAGRKVREFNTISAMTELDVHELLPGAYTVVVVDANGRRAADRIVVQ